MSQPHFSRGGRISFLMVGAAFGGRTYATLGFGKVVSKKKEADLMSQPLFSRGGRISSLSVGAAFGGRTFTTLGFGKVVSKKKRLT